MFNAVQFYKINSFPQKNINYTVLLLKLPRQRKRANQKANVDVFGLVSCSWILTFRSSFIHHNETCARLVFMTYENMILHSLSSLFTCFNSPSDLSKRWTWAIARNQHYLTTEHHMKQYGFQKALKIFQRTSVCTNFISEKLKF